MKKFKLIIWDFDGVLSDSEKLWVKVWQEMINERFGVNWDFKTADYHFGGKAIKTKMADLEKLGMPIDDDYLQKILKRELEYIEVMCTMPGAEEILQNLSTPYVLATGGSRTKTERKLAATGLKKYFPDERIFTAEQVCLGKPAPDLFLFAAAQSGVAPENCVVIEDSIPGLMAAQAAGMEVVAFIGGEMNNTTEYRKEVETLGVKNVFDDMGDVYNFMNF